jgi:hypothetical protein
MNVRLEKFIKTLNADKELIENYYKIRKFFQREGWTEYELRNPPNYPNELMSLHHRFLNSRDELFSEIKSYFGDSVDFSDFSDYLKSELYKIDLLTPLENGNNERRDNWDEDIE